MSKMNLFIGIILLVLGAILLVLNLGINPVGLVILWPIFPVLIGILFLAIYWTDKQKPDFIMPGVILFLIGIISFICSLTTWQNIRYLWPVFILAPGIGFLWLYAVGGRQKFHLIWGCLLTLVSLIFFFFRAGLEILWPVVMIVVGLVFVFIHFSRREG